MQKIKLFTLRSQDKVLSHVTRQQPAQPGQENLRVRQLIASNPREAESSRKRWEKYYTQQNMPREERVHVGLTKLYERGDESGPSSPAKESGSPRVRQGGEERAEELGDSRHGHTAAERNSPEKPETLGELVKIEEANTTYTRPKRLRYEKKNSERNLQKLTLMDPKTFARERRLSRQQSEGLITSAALGEEVEEW